MNYSGSEKLTRFIFSKSHFSVQNKTVKYGAFIPPPDSEDRSICSPDLSVYDISGLSESEVWMIGRQYVQGIRSIKARADLSVQDVHSNNLKVTSAPQLHERHANITPFPSDRLTCEQIARRLALASQLVLMRSEEI